MCRKSISKTKEAIILVADMPGVDEKTVDVVLDKNTLTISGTSEPLSFKDYSIGYCEYDVGDYQRAFTISDEVDKDKIEATVKNGVLRLILCKAEKVKARKIAIKGA